MVEPGIEDAVRQLSYDLRGHVDASLEEDREVSFERRDESENAIIS